ncbi:MAG TPA: c-type cytochrome [Saprospiraceae bacterium]|nr:c-type cytochrome [Saprospiraceae bacterium]
MKAKSILQRVLHHWPAFLLLFLLITLASCQNQSSGFVLPEGDIAEGKQVFMELHCTNCHFTDDIVWDGNPEYEDPKVELGGEVTKIKTYGELVTSIINPSHDISRKVVAEEATLPDGSSKMDQFNYNYVMTVQELTDLVAFLQSEYEVVVPTNYHYPY